MKFRVIAMLLTGFGLAIALLWAGQFTQRKDNDTPAASDQAKEKPIAIRPPSFATVGEIDGALRMSGVSEPGSTVMLTQGGQRLGETEANEDGIWSSALPLNPLETQAISLVMLTEDGARVRSDETLFRIPQVEDSSQALASTAESAVVIPSPPFDAPTLILLTAPGGPSQVFKSPFGGLPVSGPLSLGPIDYDDSGGAVFRGSSDRSGRVRLFANGIVIGDALVQEGGEWFYIIAETLPRGSYDVVVALMEGTEEITRITVPFEKMSFVATDEPGGGLYVSFEDNRWQVRRDLLGGGAQYTAIFAPLGEGDND